MGHGLLAGLASLAGLLLLGFVGADSLTRAAAEDAFQTAVQTAAQPGDDGAPWRVVLVDLETGEELWSAPAQDGDPVWYTYIHSADKTPVQSRLRVTPPPEGLVLELERYLWYGAGLEYRQDRGVVLDGEWVVVHAERAIGRLLLRVAGTVEQTVSVGDDTIILGELAAYGRRVVLEVRP